MANFRSNPVMDNSNISNVNASCFSAPMNAQNAQQFFYNEQTLPPPQNTFNPLQPNNFNVCGFGASNIPQNSLNNYVHFCENHAAIPAVSDLPFYTNPQYNQRSLSSQTNSSITFSHEVPGVPGYRVMLVFIPTNNLNLGNQQIQSNFCTNNNNNR